MQQWLFVSATGQQLSATEPELPAFARSGQIGPQTLMWRDGMAQWVPAASVFPALFAATPAATPGTTQALTTLGAAGGFIAPVASGIAPPDAATIRRLAAPLVARKGWIKLLGIVFIVTGVLTIPLGILLIFAGVALLRVSSQLERAQATGDPAALEEANKEISKYFLLHGILLLIYLCLMVVLVAFLVLGLGAGLLGALQHRNSSSPPAPQSPLTIEEVRFPDPPVPAPR